MKLTLITYESTVFHSAGYAYTENAIDFITKLKKLVDAFSKETGVSKNAVHFWHVQESNRYKDMLIIYANVSLDWQPTKDTFVVDSDGKTFHPNLAFTFVDWIQGDGYIDIEKHPPIKPHTLFRNAKT